jgi:hypothetical protein
MHKDCQEVARSALVELRKDKGRGTVKSAEWSESDGLLMFRGKIYVPKDRHAGRFKTLKLISHNYWWPQMSH